MDRRKAGLATLILVLGVSESSRAQDAPDAARGAIDGLQAMMASPLPASPRPSQCEVHLVPNSKPSERLIQRCGQWFLPPAEDLYTLWIEDGTRISRSKAPVRYWPTPFRGAGFVAEVATVEAGFVQLAATVQLRDGETLRIGSLSAPGYGFERREQDANAHKRIPMPPGRAVAGIYDARGDVVALAPLITVIEGKTIPLEPRKPAKGSDVLLVLATPSKRGAADDGASVSLAIGTSRRLPDAMHDVVGRTYAVWYGVEGTEAQLIVDSAAYAYAGPAIRLREHEVTTVRVQAESK